MKKYKFFIVFMFVSTLNFSNIITSIVDKISGGAGGIVEALWDMKTYYEMITLNANQLKSYKTQLDQMKFVLEQAKRLPKDLLDSEISKYDIMVKDMLNIQNKTKSFLRDVREFENHFSQIQEVIDNDDYKSLIDMYAKNINDLTYDAMMTQNMSQNASYNASENAKYLMKQTKNAENSTQLLEVLSKWNSNLSYQINSITETINTTNRLKTIEAQQKAIEMEMVKKNEEKTLQILKKRNEEIRKKSIKK